MSNDKYLSKPVGVPDKCPGVPAWTWAERVDPRHCYVAGWRAGVNSEYVQSLLGRIAELEAIVNTPVKLPARCECCYSEDEAQLFDGVVDEVADLIRAHGLTVQED